MYAMDNGMGGNIGKPQLNITRIQTSFFSMKLKQLKESMEALSIFFLAHLISFLLKKIKIHSSLLLNFYEER